MKNCILLAAALLLTAACDKEPQQEPQKPEKETATVSFRITAPGHDTKATFEDNTDFETISLYIFNTSTGNLETGKTFVKGTDFTKTADIKLDCTTGDKTFFFLANSMVSHNYTTLTQFMESVYTVYGGYVPTNSQKLVVMYAQTTQTITGDTEVTLNATRQEARISVKSVKNELKGSTATVLLDAIFLTNAPAGFRPDGGTAFLSDPANWYNKSGAESIASFTTPRSTFFDNTGLNLSIAHGNSASTTAYNYFCFANPYDNTSSGATWAPRNSRLVLRAKINNEYYYYPVKLPVLEPNHTYTFTEITLNHFGSKDVDNPAEYGEISYNLNIIDWETGVETTETF